MTDIKINATRLDDLIGKHPDLANANLLPAKADQFVKIVDGFEQARAPDALGIRALATEGIVQTAAADMGMGAKPNVDLNAAPGAHV